MYPDSMDWNDFCMLLSQAGVAGVCSSADTAMTYAGATMDTFQRAKVLALVRSLRPNLTDECLRSIANPREAFGWVNSTAPGGEPLGPCRLEPVLPKHYARIHEAGTTPPAGLHWRFRGATPAPQDIGDILHRGTLCHFVVLPPSGAIPEGYVALYNAQLGDGWAYFGFQRLGPGHPSLMYEGTFHFFDHCFRAFNLRRIYVEIPGYNLIQFESILDDLFEVDARLEDREYMGGRYWPLTIAHLDRRRWQEQRRRWVDLVPGALAELDEVAPPLPTHIRSTRV